MIFMFPALMSENVNHHLVPAIAKTLEQYYLQHLGFALSTGDIKVIIDETEKNPKDQLKLESEVLSEEELSYIVENLVITEKDDYKSKSSGDTEGRLEKNVNDAKEEITSLTQEINNLKIELDDISRKIDNVKKELQQLEEDDNWAQNNMNPKPDHLRDGTKWDYQKAERDKTRLETEIENLQERYKNINAEIKDLTQQLRNAGKSLKSSENDLKDHQTKSKRTGADVKIDTWDKLGMAPTTVAMTVTALRIYMSDVSGRMREEKDTQELKLIVGVKVIPSIIKNFDSLYETLRSDYYSNIFSYTYKATFRAFARLIYNTKWVRKIAGVVDWLKPTGNASLLPGWYTNILMSKAGFLDMNAFAKAKGTPSYQRYAGATVVMNLDEEEDMFQDEGHVNQLFKMGWKTFVVIDTRQKFAIICSHLDRGMCNRIPLSFLFKAVGAEKLYDSLEDLERSTGSMFKRGKFKPMKSVMKKAKRRR